MVFSQISLENTLCDVLADAVIVVNPMRDILKLNPSAETLFGISAANVTGKPLNVLFESDEGAEDLFQVEAHADPELDLTFITLRPAHSSAFSGHVSMAPLVDDNDHFEGLVFVIQDVTPLLARINSIKKISDDADISARMVNESIEKLPVCFVQIDAKGRVQYASDAYCTFAGIDRSQIRGHLITQFLTNEQNNLVLRHVVSTSSNRPLRSYEQKYLQADGSTRWYVWTVLDVFKDGQLDYALCVGNDITEIREKNTTIAAHSIELQRKNEALGQFAAIVSHDLKAPLRHIAMFADMMNEDVSSQKYDELSLYAHHVRNSAVRMDRIIKSLLQYSQISYRIVSKVQFDPAGMVINAIQNLESVIDEAKADILVGKLPILNGDAELIRHLVQNLISNAVKYRKPGVKPKIRIYATENESEVKFIIEDNGIGIDPKHANRIFGPFQRLHKDEKIYEGFGIGLALCKQIAESHDGSIELDTSYSDGSRFIVHLPKLIEAGDA